ncbi:MAG: YaiO family outer membrane beta-barrel protein [Pseudomonadota bacterium]
MLMKKGTFILFFICSSSVFALDTSEVLKESRALFIKKEWQQALMLLQNAEKEHPKDIDIQLAIARIYMWQGKNKEAEQKVQAISIDQNTIEVELLKGTIAFNQKNYTQAKTIFENIILKYPDNIEAKNALVKIENAFDNMVVWKISSGLEYSDFSRQSQSSWNQTYINLARTSNEGRTTTHSHIMRYDQFDVIDTEFEVGINHRFSSDLNAYSYGSFVSDPFFRPEYRLGVGSSHYLLDIKKIPIRALLDIRFNKYKDSEVYSINPGVSVFFNPTWVLSNNIISVFQSSEPAVFGWSTRLDGPLFSKTGFYLGYADAPETVAAVTVDTKTFFSGISYSLDSAFILNLGYTRDDREASYIRQVYNVSFRYSL